MVLWGKTQRVTIRATGKEILKVPCARRGIIESLTSAIEMEETEWYIKLYDLNLSFERYLWPFKNDPKKLV